MFNKQEEQGGFKEVETIIGPSVKVKGDFNAQGNIVVEGILEGGLKTEGSLYVGNNAKISGNIEAKEAKINGEIMGNINIKTNLDIDSSSKISGDILCSSLAIAKGALINGKITMLTKEKNKEIKS